MRSTQAAVQVKCCPFYACKSNPVQAVKSPGDAIAAPPSHAHTPPAETTHSQRARPSSNSFVNSHVRCGRIIPQPCTACCMHRQQPVTFACTMQEACPQSPDQRERRPARSKHGGSGSPCCACLCQVRCQTAAPAAAQHQQRVSVGCCFRGRAGGSAVASAAQQYSHPAGAGGVPDVLLPRCMAPGGGAGEQTRACETPSCFFCSRDEFGCARGFTALQKSATMSVCERMFRVSCSVLFPGFRGHGRVDDDGEGVMSACRNPCGSSHCLSTELLHTEKAKAQQVSNPLATASVVEVGAAHAEQEGVQLVVKLEHHLVVKVPHVPAQRQLGHLPALDGVRHLQAHTDTPTAPEGSSGDDWEAAAGTQGASCTRIRQTKSGANEGRRRCPHVHPDPPLLPPLSLQHKGQ